MSFSNKFLMVVVALVLGFAGNANAGVIHVGTPDLDYRNFGNSGIFGSVVGVIGYNAAGDGFFEGSGVMLENDYLLFAAHQGVNGINGDIVSYSVRTGADLRSPDGVFFTNTDVIFHPDYGGLFNGHDLALLKMTTPVTGITPAKLYTGVVNVGDTVSIGGYGAFGVVGGAPPIYDFNKRGYQNVISDFGPTFATPNFLAYNFQGPGDTNYLPFGGLTWQGDSGGGWFVEDGGEWTLAGLSAAGLIANNNYGSRAFGTTIDVPWVNSYVHGTTAVPEPGSFVLMSLGFGVLALKKGRKRKEG